MPKAAAINQKARAEKARTDWMNLLSETNEGRSRPWNANYWSEKDQWSRERILEEQERRLRLVAPFLYENSGFYRRRFDALELVPTDLDTMENLTSRWPVVTKEEMMEDALENPPLGTYTTIGDAQWRDRGWMHFSSSGSSGVPRVFRYTHFDRELWAEANARALYAGGLRRGDTILMATGYGPHVFAWGVQYTAAKMEIPIIPGGGLDAQARADFIARFEPTVLLCTPSYALYLASVYEKEGRDASKSSIRLLIIGGEPFSGISGTLNRIQQRWGAKALEFYGCTEASPHCGGYSCPEYLKHDQPFLHLMEEVQAWETVDPITWEPTETGKSGLTVCTNFNSESSPQLRFLVGDFTTLNFEQCQCGRNHVRAMGCITGRADDLINLRGIKFFPAQIEEAVRSIQGAGDEFEILLETASNGLDVMKVTVEHDDAVVAEELAERIRSKCEIRCAVQVVPHDSLPKTEHKARRVRDTRHGS